MENSPEEMEKNWIISIGREEIRYLRDQVSLLSGSSRANPGKQIQVMDDLKDPDKNSTFTRILETLDAMRIGALISVGGDDTMRIYWIKSKCEPSKA